MIRMLSLPQLFCLASLTFLLGCTTTEDNGPKSMDKRVDSSKVSSMEVTYGMDGDKKLIGYVAYPKDAKDAPAVLVVHEWWGQNDYPRRRADMLAELGYVAMAIDMYGNRAVAEHPKKAQEFMMKTMNNIESAEKRFKIAMDYVRSLPQVDFDKVAAIGYCFGGGVVLHMARQGVNLDGVASFHGSLGTKDPAKAGDIQAKVLVLNGAADPMVQAAQVEALKQEMKQAEADFKFVNYPGAKHGFTNPAATKNGEKFGLPLAYDKTADEKSWNELKVFLKDIF